MLRHVKKMKKQLSVVLAFTLLFGALPLEPIFASIFEAGGAVGESGVAEDSVAVEQPVPEVVVPDVGLEEDLPEVEVGNRDEGYNHASVDRGPPGENGYVGITPFLTRAFGVEFYPENTPVFYQPNDPATWGWLSHEDRFVTNPEAFYFRYMITSIHFPGVSPYCMSANRHGFTWLRGIDRNMQLYDHTDGHLVDFTTFVEGEGIYTVALSASHSEPPGAIIWGLVTSGWVYANFQETSSFVDVEGVLNDPAYFVQNPSTVTVGRPLDDEHGEYIHRWTIYRLLDNETREYVDSGERNTWLDVSTPRDIDVSDRTIFTPGRYIVVNTVEERTPLIPSDLLSYPTDEPVRFPGGPFIAVEEGAFEITEDGLLDPSITKVADREYVFEGEEIEYTITVRNPNTNHVWEDLVVVDHIRTDLVEFLPETLRIDGEVPEAGSWSFDEETGELRVYIDSLEPGEEVEITFSVRVIGGEVEATFAGMTLFETVVALMSEENARQSVNVVASEYVGFDPTTFTRLIFDVDTSTGPMIDHERVAVNAWQEYNATNFRDSISFMHRQYINHPDFHGVFDDHLLAWTIGHSYEISYAGSVLEENAGNYINFFNEERPEGTYLVQITGHHGKLDEQGNQVPVGPGAEQNARIAILIQRTESFVDIDGNRTSTASNPVENPTMVQVGRHEDDTFGHYRYVWQIVNVLTGEVVQEGETNNSVSDIDVQGARSEYAEAHGPHSVNVSDFNPGKYRVVVTVREIVSVGYPDDDIHHTSIGYFIIPVDADPDPDPTPEPGTIPNTAILYCVDGEDEVECDRDDEIVELLVRPSIEKDVNVSAGETVEIGEYVTYTLTVNNPNDVGIEDFLVVDNLANGALTGVRNVVVSSDYGYEVLSMTGELSVFLEYLPANGSIIITFEARIAEGTAPGPVVNTVYLYNYDPETGDRELINDDEAEVILEEQPTEPPVDPLDPSITKVADRSVVESFDEYIQYTLTVTNPNTVDIHDFLVIDNLANGALIGVRDVVVSPDFGYRIGSTSGTLRVYLETLPAGESVEITFYARIASGTDPNAPVVNTAYLYGPADEEGDRSQIDDDDAEVILEVEPDPTEPPTTAPDPTEPPTTVPDPTEPTETQPAPTDPVETTVPSEPETTDATEPALEAPTLTKIANRQTAEVGDTIEYRLTVNNPNEENLYDFVVVDILDLALVEFVPGSVRINGELADYEFDVVTGELRVYLDVLTPGNTNITFEVIVLASNEDGEIPNEATLYGPPVIDEDGESGDRPIVDEDDEIVRIPTPTVPETTCTEEEACPTEPTCPEQEECPTDPIRLPAPRPTTPIHRPNLPQTGGIVGSALLGGLTLTGAGLLLTSKKKKQ